MRLDHLFVDKYMCFQSPSRLRNNMLPSLDSFDCASHSDNHAHSIGTD